MDAGKSRKDLLPPSGSTACTLDQDEGCEYDNENRRYNEQTVNNLTIDIFSHIG